MLHRIIVLFIHCIYSYWWYFSWDYPFIHCIYAYWILILFLVGTIDYRWVAKFGNAQLLLGIQNHTLLLLKVAVVVRCRKQPDLATGPDHPTISVIGIIKADHESSEPSPGITSVVFFQKNSRTLAFARPRWLCDEMKTRTANWCLGVSENHLVCFCFLIQNSWWKPPLLIHISQIQTLSAYVMTSDEWADRCGVFPSVKS